MCISLRNKVMSSASQIVQRQGRRKCAQIGNPTANVFDQVERRWIMLVVPNVASNLFVSETCFASYFANNVNN